MTLPLLAVSPIDGRYSKSGGVLSAYFSEYALIQYRRFVMIEHLRFLSGHPDISLRSFTKDEHAILDRMGANLTIEQAENIKAIETEGFGAHKRTNHDVKACELYLRDELTAYGMDDVVEWVHFGRTSEDVNNIAYALMIATAMKNVFSTLYLQVYNGIDGFAERYADLPMLSRTHGQAATPTTFGKEFAIYRERLARQMRMLEEHAILVKLGSASGNHCADVAAFPKVDWIDFTLRFVARLATKTRVKLETNLVTTQIEPHDTYAELFTIMMRINTILIGFCQDIWRYISDDWIVQKPVDGEAGSSIMPHKVNPINFENAEGNFGIANALFGHFCGKLPISRLQRDLSDSTVERCFGLAFGHTHIALTALLRGLSNVSVNETKVRDVLAEHPEVLAEAYQTILRSIGYPNAYDALKSISRGKRITLQDLHDFVRSLDDALVDQATKLKLLALTPETYIGLAPILARQKSG